MTDSVPAKYTEFATLARQKYREELTDAFTVTADDEVIVSQTFMDSLDGTATHYYPGLPAWRSDYATLESLLQSARQETLVWQSMIRNLEALRLKIVELDELHRELEAMATLARRLSGGHGDTAVYGPIFTASGSAPLGTVAGALDHAARVRVYEVINILGGERWEGEAAEAFWVSFLSPFETAVEGQRLCLAELVVTVGAWHRAVESAVSIAGQLLDDGIACLNHGGAYSRSDYYSWGGIFFGVLGFTPVGWIAATAGAIGLILSFADNVDSDAATETFQGDRVEYTISAAEPPATVASVLECVTTAVSSLAELDGALERGLRADIDSPVGFLNPLLSLNPPGQETTTANFDAPKPNEVVAATVNLYTAGHVHLPEVADDCDAARHLLANSFAPAATSQAFASSSRAFADGCAVLNRSIYHTADSLRYAGAALTYIAASYEFTDEESAEFFREINLLSP